MCLLHMICQQKESSKTVTPKAKRRKLITSTIEDQSNEVSKVFYIVHVIILPNIYVLCLQVVIKSDVKREKVICTTTYFNIYNLYSIHRLQFKRLN